jgi:1,2-diacylglycerol 3-alpha-glucosyltransferase
MKIGLFTDAYYPIISGVTISVDVLKTELKKLGHEVYIITLSHPNAENEDHVIRFKGQTLPMKGLGEYSIAKVTKAKVESLQKYKFDVIHCHTEFTMGRLGRMVAKRYNIPVVHTYHTMYEDYVHFVSKAFSKPLRFLSKKYSKSFANRADEVVFPTIKVKRTFDKYGFKKPCHIIPTGIYVDNFKTIHYDLKELARLKESLGIKANNKVLLFLGRMSVEKNIKVLLQQFALLAKQDKSIVLLLVGGGPDADVFKELVQTLKITNRVIFTGMVPPHEVGYYYHIADIFVNFSTTETQGLTYIEALASGLPLLVKYDSNLEGVIKQDYNGVYFHNDNDFIESYKRLTSNEIRFKGIMKNTTLSVEKYSAKNYAKNIEKVYQKVLKKA